MSTEERKRLRAKDHSVIKEPELDQDAIRNLLRDPNCPIEAIPMLLELVNQPTAFEIKYTTATKRSPDCSMRRRYAKPAAGQVRSHQPPKHLLLEALFAHESSCLFRSAFKLYQKSCAKSCFRNKC